MSTKANHNDHIEQFLGELYEEGCRNDAGATSRSTMRFNITPNTGRFLQLLLEEARPERILEIGTSNGYSTIWLARGAREYGGRVDTVEIDPSRVDVARANLREVRLDSSVTLHCCDAGEFLSQAEPSTYDFLFLDSNRAMYCEWAIDLLRAVSLGTIVVDNATSHPEEIAAFVRYVDTQSGLSSCVLPIGKGQMIIRRSALE